MRYLLSLMLLLAPLKAQEPVNYLLLPVSLRGEYQPVTAEQFAQELVHQVQVQAPQVSVTLGAGGDSSFGIPLEQVPALCQQYGVQRVAWISVKFDHGSTLVQRQPGMVGMEPGQGTVPWRGNAATMDNFVVTVTGLADIQVADSSGQVIYQESLQLTESDSSTANNGLFGDLETKLALKTADDLAAEIVKAGGAAPAKAP